MRDRHNTVPAYTEMLLIIKNDSIILFRFTYDNFYSTYQLHTFPGLNISVTASYLKYQMTLKAFY